MLQHWIWLAQLNKVTNAQKQLLLRHFQDAEDIYHCRQTGLRQLEGITADTIDGLEDKDLTQAEQILEACRANGIGIVSFYEEGYPSRLRNTYDPPVLLYFKGKLPRWDDQPAIAVVGTRKATSYGLTVAGRFGNQIAACGALVISGAAAGVDAMAMQGALDAGKPVVGVLGCGVDVIYPRSNRKLFEQVQQQGCLISEYPPKTQACAWHFPERNRIIAGISNGLLVVEAPEKSGAMISARHAMEQGREVFAVPGNVDVPSCAGSNALLQEQAIAALSGWDVVKEYAQLWPDTVRKPGPQAAQYHHTGQPENSPVSLETAEKSGKIAIDKADISNYSVLNNAAGQLSDQEKTILAQLGKVPVSMDELLDRVDLTPGAVRSVLTRLAIKGLTQNHPGGRVSLK